MATLKYLSQYFSTTLNVGGGIDASQTTGIIIQSVSGVVDISKPGQICVSYSDPIDTGVAEWIDYTSINGSNELVGAVRGREGFSAHTHLNGASVAFVLSASHHNDVVDLLNGTEAGIKVKTALYDENGNEVIKTPATASAVNEVTVTNSATGTNPTVSATGGDTNIGLDFKPKGSGTMRKPTAVGVQVVASGTATATGDGKAFFRVPLELNGMDLIDVAASVYTAGTTNTTDIQIRNKTDSVDMLSTKITIDSTETDTSTAATPAVIDTTKDDVVTGDILAIDVDAVSTTPAQGLYVELRFKLPA